MTYVKTLEDWRKENTKLRNKNKKLVERLKQAPHEIDCIALIRDKPCTCGLDELLKGSE